MDFDKLFWNSTLEELEQGYIFIKEEGKYMCLCCGKTFEQGIIFQDNNILMEAEKAVKYHIKAEHKSMFEFLLNMDKKYTGLTDNQKNLLHLFYQGLNDKEIMKKTNSTSSTVRNNRFSLRERAKQAKIYLGIMNLLEKRMENSMEQFVSIHRSATNIDERYAITESEKEICLKKYFKNEKLLMFPNKQKRIIIVLQHIVSLFEKNRIYSEKEVNMILLDVYSDFATIRRYLIEYGFLDRKADCSEYWVKL